MNLQLKELCFNISRFNCIMDLNIVTIVDLSCIYYQWDGLILNLASLCCFVDCQLDILLALAKYLERAWIGLTLGSLVCDMVLCFVTFPYGGLGQVWYLIVSIPDLCLHPYFGSVIKLHFSLFHFTFWVK